MHPVLASRASGEDHVERNLQDDDVVLAGGAAVRNSERRQHGDGRDGGYAMAAVMLKEQLRKARGEEPQE